MVGVATVAAREEMLITVPWSAETIAGKNSLISRKWDSIFTLNVRATEASVVERIGRTLATPALLKRRVGTPRSSRMAAAVVERALGEVMSHS